MLWEVVKLLTPALLLMLVQLGSSAVPVISDGHDSISSAMHIQDPFRAQEIYGALGPGAVHYYSLDLQGGEAVSIRLRRSPDPDEQGFLPGMALGARDSEEQPSGDPLLEAGVNWRRIAVKDPYAAAYEPFFPSSYRELGGLDFAAPSTGVYYLAVYSNGTPGHYSLGIGGQERLSLLERMTMPVRLLRVYMWEGQGLVTMVLPYILAVCLALLVYWRSHHRSAFLLTGGLAGSLFLATSASVLSQMVFCLIQAPFGPEAYITLMIAFFHALLGVATLRLSKGREGALHKAIMAAIGTLALLAGSGLVAGPAMAIAAAILPPARRAAVTADAQMSMGPR